MANLTGKTHAIIQRLPHFYNPPNAGDLIAQLVDLFGRALERTERDLYQVLHAHHVETADNLGSQGYTAAPDQRGDLDKIFALYLEAIGGTTQLVKLSPYVSARSFPARRLAQLLHEASDPVIVALRARLSPATQDLLARYAVDNCYFQPTEMQPGLVEALLLAQPVAGFPPSSTQPALLAYLVQKLRPPTHTLLAAYRTDAPLDPALPVALAADFNEVLLRDPALYRQNRAEFDRADLSPVAWTLIYSLYGDFLRQQAAAEPDPGQQASLLAALAQAEPPLAPPGDDLVRLNRLLLEGALAVDPATRPWGFTPRAIPALAEVRTALVEGLNGVIQGEELFRPDWFPELVEEYPALCQHYANNTLWLNRVVLEAAFPTALEKSYKPYQERLRG